MLEQIPKSHMEIWCADANGKLGQQEQNDQNKKNKVVEKYTHVKTEPGNGNSPANMRNKGNDTNEHMEKG